MANLQQFANNASSLLAGSNITDLNSEATYAITAGQSVPYIYVAEETGKLFPSPVDGDFFLITVEDILNRNFEIFRVVSRAGDKLIISTRSDEGTLPNNFPIGSKVELRWTKGSIERLRQYSREVGAGYVHTQTSTSTSWVIQHNLNKQVEVQVLINNGTGGFYYAEAEINYVDANNIVVDFSEAVSGKVIVR